jgi:phosphoribosylglycinamide formyltransferase-1
MKNIAIFASGEGTNAENIIRYFQHNDGIKIKIVLSDNKAANVLNRSKKHNIPYRAFTKHEFYETDEILNHLIELKIDLIVLAGFLKLIPEKIIKEFKARIVNIHPALLPKYGGKGMYGMNVHQKVFDSKEKETGITIHQVNEKFDEGEIIFQKKIAIDETDSPVKILERIRKLELEFYPKVIEKMLNEG